MEERSAGVLLHISSLPGPYGIGDLGREAHSFAEALAEAGLVWWQFLPLAPTSEFIGNSPYSSPSAFAGNPLFISPDALCAAGLISQADMPAMEETPLGPSDYALAASLRRPVLNAAFERQSPRLEADSAFQNFCKAHAYWLDDYALFTAIKEAFDGASWTDWPEPLKWRDALALAAWGAKHWRAVLRHKFIQYLFFSQFTSLRERCAELGVRLMGDMPIYVTHDSADVWAAPELFKLDASGQPVTVAGVPPDYFSETGQRWGNPVYNWKRMAQDGFAWWKRRLAHNLLMVDLVRLDHFRGFAGYWEIPASEDTAINGAWTKGPGVEFFKALCDEFGEKLPIIAEDLGIITDDVREIMAMFKLPGMKLLHFAFGGQTPWDNLYAPFRHQPCSVVYTGTHDNTTTLDWYVSISAEERQNFCNYIGRELLPREAPELMIRLALESASEIAIIPMQDIMGLGGEARMNTPSVAQGNWVWRLPDASDIPEFFSRLHGLCRVYGRAGHIQQENGDSNA